MNPLAFAQALTAASLLLTVYAQPVFIFPLPKKKGNSTYVNAPFCKSDSDIGGETFLLPVCVRLKCCNSNSSTLKQNALFLFSSPLFSTDPTVSDCFWAEEEEGEGWVDGQVNIITWAKGREGDLTEKTTAINTAAVFLFRFLFKGRLGEMIV